MIDWAFATVILGGLCWFAHYMQIRGEASQRNLLLFTRLLQDEREREQREYEEQIYAARKAEMEAALEERKKARLVEGEDGKFYDPDRLEPLL